MNELNNPPPFAQSEPDEIDEINADLGKTYYLDQVAIEAMKILLKDEDIEPHESIEDFQNSVADGSYGMARAMWRAKNGELEASE